MKTLQVQKADKGNIAKVEFTDGQLVFIAKVYTDITMMTCDAQKLTQQQVATVFNYLKRKI